MSHEQSEVALEMRAHGALGDVEASALDEHLKVCAECRELERQIRIIDASMRSHARELAESPALAKVRQKVTERVALKRYVFVAIAIAVCIAMTSFGVYLSDLVNHGESDFDVIADLRKQVPVMYTLAIVMLATWWDERRKALRAAATEGELIAFYRKQLDREIRDERQLAFISLALGGLFFMGFFDWETESLRRFIVPTAALLFFVGVFLRSMSVKVPRMIREREELA